MTCENCPKGRGGIRGTPYYCPPCKQKARRRAWDKYSSSPKAKITRANYDDTHPEQRRARWTKHNAKRARSGRVIGCATGTDTAFPCKGRFVRTPTNGRRKFCDDCRRFFHIWVAPKYRLTRSRDRARMAA